MTQKQIIEGNKLIAEFMGLEIITDGISWFDTNYKSLGNYDSDWNLLMSVVDKIEDLRCKDIEDNEIQWFVVIGEGADCRIYHDYSDVDEIIVYGAESKIVAAWQAIVEFVRSYLKGENESSTN